jgi:sugar/nucleoside kinase (ribokinase family)
MALIVTGTIGIDTVVTPTSSAEKILGGSATYFAVAASFFGKVRLVAAVGGDFPPAFAKFLKGYKAIDTRGLEVRPNSKTFAWGGKYREDMNSRDTLFTELGVLAEAPPVVPSTFADSKFVFLANTHPGVQAQLLSSFPKRTLAVADTMDLWINTARKELEALLRQIDGLVLNYDEAELFTGKKNPVTAARHILADFGSGKNSKRGLKFVVVKKGEHGSLIIHHDGIAALPAYPAEKVVDPTGAGDTFAGGLMGYLASTGARTPTKLDTLRKASAMGTVMASFNIEAFSLDRLKTLKKAEIAKRAKQFAKMINV